MSKSVITGVCFLAVVLMAGCVPPDCLTCKSMNPRDEIIDKEQSGVIVYCFHRTTRCPTCVAIEKNTVRVMEYDFPQELYEGKLSLASFNLDGPGGEGYEREFSLDGSTVVVAKLEGGKHTKYKKLEKVWEYIGNPEKFDEYLQTEVKQFLDE